jgi:type II secretory pathway component PulK
MTFLRRLWDELTRPRGPVSHRFHRAHRRSESGVALLLVLTSVLFLTVIATDIAFSATTRLRLAAHQRDEAKAEYLAQTGVGMYQLILSASKAIGKNPMFQQVEQMLGIDLGDALWQMIPSINSEMMRMIFVTDGDLDEVDEEGMTDEQIAESREETGMERNFLDFDGDFTAEVTDEDRKINVAKFTATNRADLQQDPVAVKLDALMSGSRVCPDQYAAYGAAAFNSEEREELDKWFYDRNLEKWEIIGNLADWTDPDTVRVYDGGNEENVYQNLERDPYLPKNAAFDTLEEMRLVDLWNRDDVWEKFGGNLTVYGSGKVNINTAECPIMWALLKTYLTPQPNDAQVSMILQQVQQQRMLIGTFPDPNSFISFLGTQGVNVDPKMRQAIHTDSKVFRVTSSGQVGDSIVTVDAVIDYRKSATGKVVYWRVR